MRCGRARLADGPAETIYDTPARVATKCTIHDTYLSLHCTQAWPVRPIGSGFEARFVILVVQRTTEVVTT